jgi:adenylate cyclase
LAIAVRSGDPAKRMGAYVAMAQTVVLTGEPETARELCDRALMLPRDLSAFPSDPPGTFGVNGHQRRDRPLGDIGDARAMILTISAGVLALTGYIDQALRRSDEAVAAAGSSGPHSLIVAINSSAELRFRLRDWDGVLERAAAVENLAEEREMPLWSAYARALRGQVFIHRDRVEEGIELITAAARVYETTPATGYQWRIHYADALGRLGRADEALALISEIETHLTEVGWAVSAAELQRLRGEFLLRRAASDEPAAAAASSEPAAAAASSNGPSHGTSDDLAAAEASFRNAIEIARCQHARLFELRAANGLARMLDSLGRRDEAFAILGEIYGHFTEGFDARDLKDARALLDRLADQPASPSPIQNSH